MAGEVIGKICEAAVALSIDLSGISPENVHWGKRPKGMSIHTDFLIGVEPDHPESVILVTHSTSAKQLDKKFWRNMGELFELRSLLPTIPVSVNVIFGYAQMKRLDLIMGACFDLSIRLSEIPDTDVFMKELVTASIACKTKTKEASKEYLTKHLSLKSKEILKNLGMRIAGCIKRRAIPTRDLWLQTRANISNAAREVKRSALKRGSSKLLLFSKEDRANIFEAAKFRKKLSIEAFSLARSLRITGGLQNRFVTDEDICLFARDWTLDDLEYLVSCAPTDDLNRVALEPIQAIPNLITYAQYVRGKWSQLTTPDGMLRALIKCHQDPASLCNLPLQVSNVWLVDYLLTIAKTIRGGHNVYGQSQLAEDAGVDTGISASGYRVFADWLNRREKGKLPEETLRAVASTLAKELQAIEPDILSTMAKELQEKYIRTYYEIKLLTYEKYDPLSYLIKRAFNNSNIPWNEYARFPSVFGEMAGVAGATSKVIVANNSYYIYWKSATEEGRDHKKKELCGRAVALRYTWDSSLKRFMVRPNLKKLIVVLDGTWRQEDLDALARSGWDEIFYPDEMDKVVAAII